MAVQATPPSFPPPGLSLWSRIWERLKYLACGRCIFFIHEQVIISAVIPDCCENACGQKRTLQNFHLDLRCILTCPATQNPFICEPVTKSKSVEVAWNDQYNKPAPAMFKPTAPIANQNFLTLGKLNHLFI
jgi:hypothetical protein